MAVAARQQTNIPRQSAANVRDILSRTKIRVLFSPRVFRFSPYSISYACLSQPHPDWPISTSPPPTDGMFRCALRASRRHPPAGMRQKEHPLDIHIWQRRFLTRTNTFLVSATVPHLAHHPTSFGSGLCRSFDSIALETTIAHPSTEHTRRAAHLAQPFNSHPALSATKSFSQETFVLHAQSCRAL